TTLGWNGSNNLYVLDQQDGLLQIVGKLENLANGERIYAVRYLGDTAFVVTFRQTDPLFTVDLSDPANPHVIGELRVPGFSLYLQMVAPNFLLGFGRDADVNGRTQGLELSLFDVSDLSAPIMVQHLSLSPPDGNPRWMYSPAETDHHAFIFNPSSGDLT